jgi:hypothetical protein
MFKIFPEAVVTGASKKELSQLEQEFDINPKIEIDNINEQKVEK